MINTRHDVHRIHDVRNVRGGDDGDDLLQLARIPSLYSGLVCAHELGDEHQFRQVAARQQGLSLNHEEKKNKETYRNCCLFQSLFILRKSRILYDNKIYSNFCR